jgi:hypothetical protein
MFDFITRRKGVLVFIGVFLFAFFLHSIIWSYMDFFDGELWKEALQEALSGDGRIDEESLVFGYPADTLLFTSKLVLPLLPSPGDALIVSMALIISLLIAAVSLSAYLLRPSSPWWIFAAVLLTFSPFYLWSTPPSAFMTLLVPWLFLTVLLLEERKLPEQETLLLIGLIMGLMVETRLDISVLLCLSVCGYLFFALKKSLWMPLSIAALFVLALNPYVFDPTAYLGTIMYKIGEHAAGRLGSSSHAFEFVTSLTFELISVLLISLGLLLKYRFEFSTRFLAWCLATTMGLSLLLKSGITHHNPLWFFLPLFSTWTIVAPFILASFLLKHGDEVWESKLLKRHAVPFLAGVYITYYIISFVRFIPENHGFSIFLW